MAFNTYKYGIMAEYISCIMLIIKGYNILARRHRNYLGEIDIIARKGKILVFIEVKARKKFSEFMNILTNRQRMRIESAAKVFLASNPRYQGFNIRFDMIILNGWLPIHQKNMW